jgi:hypothetical protein
MTLRAWIILILFFGLIIMIINFLCFSARLDAEGHSGDVQSRAEEKVTEEIQSQYGLPTLDTFRVKCNNKVWKVTGRWRVDSKEYDYSEYVCIAHGTYEVIIEYRGREDRYYADNCAIYDMKEVNILTNYIRGQKSDKQQEDNLEEIK